MSAATALVVDDATTVRLYHRSILEAAGFMVAVAADGMEALEHVAGRSFDLVVVDVNMPVMDGHTLTRELRARPGSHSVPVIMVSSEASEADRRAGYAAGANYYVVKPAPPETLREAALRLTGRMPP